MEQRKDFKIVTLGNSGVGKTSLVSKFVNNEFNEGETSTISARNWQKDFSLQNGDNVKLSIWDTGGQERYRSLAPMYYRGAEGVILTYDITRPDSFESTKRWANEVRLNADPNACIVLVGNKSDFESQRQVSEQVAIEYATSIGASHFTASARIGQNVHEIFEDIAKRMLLKSSAS